MWVNRKDYIVSSFLLFKSSTLRRGHKEELLCERCVYDVKTRMVSRGETPLFQRTQVWFPVAWLLTISCIRGYDTLFWSLQALHMVHRHIGRLNTHAHKISFKNLSFKKDKRKLCRSKLSRYEYGIWLVRQLSRYLLPSLTAWAGYQGSCMTDRRETTLNLVSCPLLSPHFTWRGN